MPEPLMLAAALIVAGAFVLVPLWRPPTAAQQAEPDDDRDALVVRHRVALESLRDVEADLRAGSLDEAGYAEQRAAAEGRAAETRAALERGGASLQASDATPRRPGRGLAAASALAIGALLLAGSVLPASGIANQTDVNLALADAQAAESARQDRIGQLLDALAADPRNPATLSSLADAYLAGSSEQDLVGAAVALQALIAIEPERADAYERIIGAYLRAGDHAQARAAHTSYAEIEAADPVEVAFLDGVVATREGDDASAVAAFDRFLELAPADPRAGMVRGLREDAAGE